MELRRATEGDLAAQEEIFRAAIGEVYEQRNLVAPTPPSEAFRAQHRHLLRHDAERCWVAEEDGVVVGYSAALARGEAWHLSSLFVAPDRHGAGIGKSLLERAWGRGYRNRRTLTDAIQPVSNGLYASRGLIPVAPNLHLGGEARAEDPGLEPGPLAATDGAAAADAFRAEVARSPGAAAIVVPGTSRELVASALECGLRFTRPPGLLLLGPRIEPPRAVAISGYSLF